MDDNAELFLKKRSLSASKVITLAGSKSISNRLLVLQKLFGNITLENVSTSQDTELLKTALSSSGKTVDIHHAGTAMRFLTAYFSILDGKTTILTGSQRMKQRPIAPLATALKSLGADIEYLGQHGYPPLKITGKTLENDKVEIAGNISSQFVTALILIAAKLPKGLSIRLTERLTSRPYLEMTLKILAEVGIDTSYIGDEISVRPLKSASKPIAYTVESDWSSASYYYALCAIGRKEISLKNFKADSLQADISATDIYRAYFGVETIFGKDGKINLRPVENFSYVRKINIDMNDCPDIAQTVCVTAAALRIPFQITGLATLKVKETDRLLALKNELEKIGCNTEITQDAIASLAFIKPEKNILINTYQDHRMAMSFAPIALLQDIRIENPSVVQKSYPKFWEDFSAVTVAI